MYHFTGNVSAALYQGVPFLTNKLFSVGTGNSFYEYMRKVNKPRSQLVILIWNRLDKYTKIVLNVNIINH